jgi:hypothetical protein
VWQGEERVEERGWAYRRRQPEGTVLCEAVKDNLATLLEEASEVGRGLPRYVERNFARYLECEVLAHGFARVRCESFQDELISLQQRLRWTEVDVPLAPRKQPRCAFLEGFSLHANTHLHANDRQGLERRCRYRARGALALERLSRAEEGRSAYRMRRPLPDGTPHLLFTGLELLRRLASLVPPPRTSLTRFHGVFAPGAKVRPLLLPQAGAEPGLEDESPALAATEEELSKERPRLDWAGLFKQEVRPGGVRVREVWRQA